MAKDGQEGHPFADASVSFAVDVSGSTSGRPLECEKNFVRKIATLLSGRSQTTAKVLPWHSSASSIRPLSSLDSLTSGLGTSPRVLLEDNASRAALTESNLWFLMTDGLVSDFERQAFANGITQAGLHGTSCVTVIFGNPTRGPRFCNISVGVSVFALCPDCLFLFYDTDRQDITIMQAKGIFNSVLRGADNPVFDESSNWDSFPRLSLSDLSDIVIPVPTKLGTDEVQLQNSLVINFNDLWANKLDQEKVATIFDNEDNLTTVTMNAQSIGRVTEFQTWLQQQRPSVENALHKARVDIKGQAQAAFLEVRRAEGDEAGKDDTSALRAKLRAAHDHNMEHFLQTCKTSREQALLRQDRIHSAFTRSTKRISTADSLNRTSHYSTINKRAAAPVPLSHLLSKKTKQDHFSGASTASSQWEQVSQVSGSTQQSWVDVADNISLPGLASPPAQQAALRPPQQDGPCIAPADLTKATQDEEINIPPKSRLSSRVELYKARKAREAQWMNQSVVMQTQKRRSAPDHHTQSTDERTIPAPTVEPPTYTYPSMDGLLWTPGFRADDNGIKGACSICGGTNKTLALLLNQGARPVSTSLGVGQPEGPQWPSHVSHLPRNLLEVRNVRCCEACSTYWVANSAVPADGKADKSIPIVDYGKNQTSYHARFRELFDGCSYEHAPQRFLFAMLMAYGKEEARVSNVKDDLRWVCANLISGIIYGQPAHDDNASSLGNDLRQLSSDADASLSRVARYPLPGFLTLLQAAAVLKVSEEVRLKMAFRRYLFLLSEGFDRMAKNKDKAELNQRLADLLWQQGTPVADEPDLVIVGRAPSPELRTPVLTLPTSKLRSSELLSQADFELATGAAEEFRQLLGDGTPDSGWVGRVTVVFLHALADVHEKHTYKTADDLFGIVATRKEVTPVFEEPGTVDVDGVEAMLKLLRV